MNLKPMSTVQIIGVVSAGIPSIGWEVLAMVKQMLKGLFFLSLSILVFSCGVGQKAELEVKVQATLDGEPASEARVLIDGAQVGLTDNKGNLTQKIWRQPGKEVSVEILLEAPGYQVEPWKDSFVVKLPQGGATESYAIEASLKATKYFTLAVSDEGEPLENVSVIINGKKRGKTNEAGEYVHTYESMPKKGMSFNLAKEGYTSWRKKVRVKPGQTIVASLARKREVAKAEAAPSAGKKHPVSEASASQSRSTKKPPRVQKGKIARVFVSALTETYGVTEGIPGVVVSVDDKQVGKTNREGKFTYVYGGEAHGEVGLKLTAPGHIPAEWKTRVKLRGKQSIERIFYPLKPKPIRVGLYGYVNNTPEEDLADVVGTIEKAIGDNLFIYGSFVEVPKAKLRQVMLDAGLDLETMSTKGWRQTKLIDAVDMIISGSVTQNDQVITIESTVNFSDGSTLLSQINKVMKKKQVEDTIKLVVNNIIEQFPFEGTVVATEQNRYQINLGRLDYKIRRGNEFNYMTVEPGAPGKNGLAYQQAGLLVVNDNEENSSWAELANLKDNEQIGVGAKVVRRVYLEDMARDSFVLAVRAGSPTNSRPLWGVNVYLDNTWVGTTGSDGTAVLPVRLHTEHDLLLSRYGYEPLQDKLKVEASNEVKEFSLDVANALFKVDSEPSGAAVFVDGVEVGKTPLLEGTLVNFGFRKVKLSAGGEYRDWEKVLEFNESTVDRTGTNRIVLVKDYLKIGRMAEQNGNIDEAIAAYGSTERGHPDYSDAHHRLAQLYLDEKGDYDAAIREFENVLSLPENKQIIYKQFAVTYTNLGHAYYEKANQLIHTDKQAAAANYAKAVEKLKIAKQNTRFFPNKYYQEAVHDTYYYQAMSYHKLFLLTKKKSILDRADLAWKEYFDFFPKELEGKSEFTKIRQSSRKYWAQLKDLK
ncbi:MAG: PEGA domain-containing protein [Deltaproteobacteria bacterium]